MASKTRNRWDLIRFLDLLEQEIPVVEGQRIVAVSDNLSTRGADEVEQWLADGTPYFAPLGEMVYDPDEDRVQCHLCGEWFRIVGSSHLISKHGWTVAEYRQRFGLLTEDPTCAAGLSERLRVLAVARIAAGELNAGSPYRKPRGTGGRGVRRSRSLGVLRPDLVAELNSAVRPLQARRQVGQDAVVALPALRARLAGCPTRPLKRRRLPNMRPTASQPDQQPLVSRALPAIKRPGLLAELHQTRNPSLDPYALGAGSGQKIWWHRSRCGNEWKADPATRARGKGCPACGRR